MRMRLFVVLLGAAVLAPGVAAAQDKKDEKKPKGGRVVTPDTPDDAEPPGSPSPGPPPAPRRDPPAGGKPETPAEPSGPIRKPPAEDKEEKETDDKPRIPLNPFDSSKEGDWSTYVYVSKKQGQGTTKESLLYRVEKLEEEAVTFSETKNPYTANMSPAKNQVIARKENVPVHDYIRLHWSFDVKDVQVTEEKKKVGGREFNCKKVSFKASSVDQNNSFQVWISTDVKGGGLVAMSVWGAGANTFQNDIEVIGFGNGETAEWGKKAEDIDLSKIDPK